MTGGAEGGITLFQTHAKWLPVGLTSFARGCLRTRRLASPTPSKTESTRDGSHGFLYKLVSEVASRVFCHSLFVRIESVELGEGIV